MYASGFIDLFKSIFLNSLFAILFSFSESSFIFSSLIENPAAAE